MTPPMSPDEVDLVDFEELCRDPELASAVADAEARSSLRAALVVQRKTAKLTQADVAVAMDTTQSAVSDFERGGTEPHLSTMQRYARAVGARLLVTVSLASPHDDEDLAPECHDDGLSSRGRQAASGSAHLSVPNP